MFEIYLISLLLLSNVCGSVKEDFVSFKPMNRINSFNVPLAKYPIVSWMDIQHGIYPNIYPIKNEVKVGNPLTILIYVSDINNLYDVTAKDCYAYDTQDPDRATHVHHFDQNKESKSIKWTKIVNRNESIILLHSNLIAFKFPDRNKIFLTCNFQLCYKVCKKD